MKRFQSIGALLSAVTIMLVVLLLSVFALAAWRAYDEREAARVVAANVALARQLLDVRAMLRYEATDLTVSFDDDAALTQPEIEKLLARHGRTMAAIRDLAVRLAAHPGHDPQRLAELSRLAAAYDGV